jgi:hypothetical protein
METFFQRLLPFIIEYKEAISGTALFLLLWYLIHRFRVSRQPFRAASTDNGSVFVSRATVLNLIRSACAEIEGGSVKRVQCINKRRLLLLKLYISLDVNQSFEVSSMRFQEAAKNAVTHCLGALKAVRVDVVLDGVKGEYGDSKKSVASIEPLSSDIKNAPAMAFEGSSVGSSEEETKSEDD